MKRIVALVFILIVLALIALSRFGPTVEESKVYYYSPVWSPDAKSVAYFKRSMKYSYTSPFLKLPALAPERTYSFKKDSLELIINEFGASGERVIKKLTNSVDKVDPTDIGAVDAKIIWYLKGYLQYAIITSGFTKDLDTGNNFIRPDGEGNTWVSLSYDARTKIISSSPIIMNNKELYPRGSGSAIFVFDHNDKTVKLLVGEKAPLPKYRPYTPPSGES